MRSFTIPIIIANIIVFVIQMANEPFTALFVLKKFDIIYAPYTLITSMFMHGSIPHIFFNMYVLLMFGPLLEQRIGPRNFLMLYFGSGLIAAILSQFIYPAALGASGAIMGLIGATIIIMPHLKVLFFFIIPMPLWFAGVIIAVIDIFGVFGVGLYGIANVAHLAGMGAGLAYGLRLKKRKRRFYKRFEKRTQMDEDDIEEYLKNGRI